MCQICTKMYNPPSLLITCLTDWLVVLQCAPAAVAACMNVIIQPTWLILFDSSARARLAKTITHPPSHMYMQYTEEHVTGFCMKSRLVSRAFSAPASQQAIHPPRDLLMEMSVLILHESFGRILISNINECSHDPLLLASST